ncbi:MAG: hypothetical protein V4615_16760, partial [Bacteroidota bacterium]
MKKMNTLCAVLAISIASITLQAQQTYDPCGTMEYLNEQLLADPGLAGRMQQIEQQVQQYVQSNPNGNSRAVITIPVVVHVVYRTAAENISDA